MLRGFPMNTISERTITSQGVPITVTTVNGMSRIEINNKLHDIGDQLLKLRMQQQHLVEMRDQLDRQNDMREMGDLFDEMFGG
jgi:ribosomal protein L29